MRVDTSHETAVCLMMAPVVHGEMCDTGAFARILMCGPQRVAALYLRVAHVDVEPTAATEEDVSLLGLAALQPERTKHRVYAQVNLDRLCTDCQS